jgi:hypothetical protein
MEGVRKLMEKTPAVNYTYIGIKKEILLGLTA